MRTVSEPAGGRAPAPRAGALKNGGFAMVFISYSWDSEEHAEKVGRLVKLLKKI